MGCVWFCGSMVLWFRVEARSISHTHAHTHLHALPLHSTSGLPLLRLLATAASSSLALSCLPCFSFPHPPPPPYNHNHHNDRAPKERERERDSIIIYPQPPVSPPVSPPPFLSLSSTSRLLQQNPPTPSRPATLPPHNEQVGKHAALVRENESRLWHVTAKHAHAESRSATQSCPRHAAADIPHPRGQHHSLLLQCALCLGSRWPKHGGHPLCDARGGAEVDSQRRRAR